VSTSAILSILGIIVSLLFGAWGIYLAVSRRYPGEITFVREQTIPLFDAIVKNLPEMAVLYKTNPVSPNVVLLRGSLINTGSRDISSLMVERPISLRLPEGSRWLSATVISRSRDVKASVKIVEPRSISFENGLLRRNEFIRFQALADMSNKGSDAEEASARREEYFKDSLHFDHRIQDTGSVKSFELLPSRSFVKRYRSLFVFIALGILFLIGYLIFYELHGFPSQLAYDFQVSKDEITRVYIKDIGSKAIKVKSVDGKFSATIPREEFFAKCQKPAVLVPDKYEILRVFIVMAVLYILGPAVLLAVRMREHRANKRLRRLLGLDPAQTLAAETK
jgi:hypothetical protein